MRARAQPFSYFPKAALQACGPSGPFTTLIPAHTFLQPVFARQQQVGCQRQDGRSAGGALAGPGGRSRMSCSHATQTHFACCPTTALGCPVRALLFESWLGWLETPRVQVCWSALRAL